MLQSRKEKIYVSDVTPFPPIMPLKFKIYFSDIPKSSRESGASRVFGLPPRRGVSPKHLKKGAEAPYPTCFRSPKERLHPHVKSIFYLKFNKKLQHIFIFTKARKHYRQHRKKQNKRPLARQENIFLGKRGREKQNFKSCGALGYDTA